MTQKEKLMLENKIYRLIKESFYENTDNIYYEDGGDDKDNNKKSGVAAKRNSVLRWLKSDQVDMARIAYKLWDLENASDDEKDTARGLFTKKVNGKDPDGNAYSFDDDEITKLYNIKGGFISNYDD